MIAGFFQQIAQAVKIADREIDRRRAVQGDGRILVAHHHIADAGLVTHNDKFLLVEQVE